MDLAELFRLSPLPTLLLSSSYQIQLASQSFLDAWELTTDDCKGQTLLDLFHQQGLASTDEGRASLTHTLSSAVVSRQVTKTPRYHRREYSWSARIIPFFKDDELLSLVLEWEKKPIELTERGLSTDEAFRILVYAVKDYAIFLLDTRGYIVTWNTGAELNKGYKSHEIIGKHFSVFYGEEDLKAHKPEMELEVCLREGHVEDEGWRYRKDGTRFWANVIITAIYKDGLHVGFGKVTRDLSERKNAERRLISAYEESEKLKSDFLANMSHECVFPLFCSPGCVTDAEPVF